MAVRIRLKRMGAKKRPFYRLVVADARNPRDGRVIDQVGHYDPMSDPVKITVDTEKALEWLKRGAQPSEPALRLLRKSGVWAQFRPGDGEKAPESRGA
ncbi:MAG TPA: 30S ribosomal protein S16 [Limnochordia bacterium]